jgi:hypothetical protein
MLNVLSSVDAGTFNIRLPTIHVYVRSLSFGKESKMERKDRRKGKDSLLYVSYFIYIFIIYFLLYFIFILNFLHVKKIV